MNNVHYPHLTSPLYVGTVGLLDYWRCQTTNNGTSMMVTILTSPHLSTSGLLDCWTIGGYHIQESNSLRIDLKLNVND